MMRMRLYGPALAAMVCTSMMTACGSNPTGPDSADQPTTTQSASSGPVATPPPAPPANGECAIKDIDAKPVNFTGGGELPETVRVKVSNAKGTSCSGIRLTAWNAADAENQVFIADSEERFPPSDELSVKLPCGTYVQLDVNNSPYTPAKGKYSPGYFVKAWWGRTAACSTPNPGPTPTPTPTPQPPTYGLTVTKAVKEKTCARPQQTATVTFEIAVTNTSSVAANINVSDLAVPSCNRTPLTLNAGQSSTYTCTGIYGTGPGSNVVTASIAGQSVSQSATVNFTVDACPPEPTCRDFPPPVVNVSLGTPVTSQTETTFTVVSIPVTQTAGVTGVMVPAPPQTTTRPSAGGPAGNMHFDYNWEFGYQPAPGLNCSLHGSVPKNVSVPPQVEERDCEDVKPRLSCSVSGNDATCLTSWQNPGSGSLKLDSGSWQSVANPGSRIYNDLSVGSHSVRLRVEDGGLTCEDVEDFTIEPQGCADVPATSMAAQPFSLPNSSVQTETNWVNANVSPGPYVFWAKHESFSSSCTTAGFSAKVVLLKAGTSYWYFLNVVPGQQLCSGGQDISHITKFRCPS